MIMASNIKIKDNRSTYPGGKGGSGVYQTIINLIPPHDVYIETHLGGGSILKHKRPATINIGIDIDPEVTSAWEAAPISINGVNGSGTASTKLVSGDEDLIIINTDATRWLKEYQFQGNEFIYVDPPYLMETRKGGKLYDCEMTDEQHIELLSVLDAIPTNIMISGYWSSLYSKMLTGWNTVSFEAQTRQGPATEWLWFNYPAPKVLHDYSYLGNDFRERERIKKKRDRWVSRLLRTPDLERNAILTALINSLPDPLPVKKAIEACTGKNDDTR